MAPERSRAVVIGGGVIGCSCLYHLAKEGWTDSVLVEQFQLTHGSTWHSAGLVGQLRGRRAPVRARNECAGDGVEHVLVNGVEIARHGRPLDARPGRVLRSGRDTMTVLP